MKKITIYEGCTAYDTIVDDISTTDEQFNTDEFLDYIFPKIREGIKDGTVSLNNVIQLFQYDDYGSDNRSCEQCGDTVSWTTWEI